ncbi:uncharacterized protein LOC130820473 [Amaranthus tricolor]|uniref:uncharacterized protein LOC130820473 n=1 Tax=Amaranthus tricolor TaxID=29722 RepID=UPI002583112C|nr:uncharacterized protein LOC130820473 [Amaranthus tricolor]
MGFSESDSSECRRHLNQRQIPGVCSSCLREKLTKLSTSPSFNRSSTFISYTSSLSSSPPYSTASSSSTTTTTRTRKSSGPRHRRNGSEAYVSVGMVLNNGLKKSRSVSCAPLSKNRNFDCVSDEKGIIGKNKNKNLNFVDGHGGKILEDGDMKKKGGFLKKLIHSTSRKTKGVLTHSKTLKETQTSHNMITKITKTKN